MMNYIYLHGFCSGAASYKGTFFRKKFEELGLVLHTPDLNDNDFEHLTITGQMRLVRKFAGSLDGEITMMGSSMGAFLAALYAEENERTVRLVLLAPAFRFLSRYAKTMGDEYMRAWQKRGYIEVFHYAYNEDRRLHHGIVEDARGYDETALERQIPALVLQGLEDESVPFELSLEYLRANGRAELVLLHADHKFTDKAERLWDYMREYLGL